MWAFIAAALSACVSPQRFESAFGFERFSRGATETASALAIARTHGPRASSPATDEELMAFVVASNVCCAARSTRGREVAEKASGVTPEPT